MFKNLFGNQEKNSKTGFFKVEKETLVEINQLPGNGSINSCIESLGFSTNHIHIVFTFDSDKIDCLGFMTLSQNLVFVSAKKREIKLSYSDVQRELKRIDWAHEYSSLNAEDILSEGIEAGNFDIEFLKSVIDLRKDSESIYKSEQLGLYLQFANGILTAFTSTSFDNSATKWLTELNPVMAHQMKEEAKQYQQNDIDAMDEVNKQVQSLLSIPNAVKNEFIPLHTKNSGNINFYNLMITHYSQDCNIEEFLFMNKGRFRKNENNTIEVNNFIYSFNEQGQLNSSIRK